MTSLTPGERRLATILGAFGWIFAFGALAFFVRPEGTIADLDRIGVALGLPSLPSADRPIGAEFWLILAVANMATIAACCFLAARDVRGLRSLVYPVIVSKLTSSSAGLLLFAFRAHAFPFLSATLVDFPIAVILLVALRAAPLPASERRAA